LIAPDIAAVSLVRFDNGSLARLTGRHNC
jgi:hypothetical protein